jgi:hypothetical protein
MKASEILSSRDTFSAAFDQHIPIRKTTRSIALDAVIALAVGLIYAAFAAYLYRQIDFAVMCRSLDIWFDSDPVRIVSSLNSRFDLMHFRSSIHPLWSLLVTSPFILLVPFIGLEGTILLYVLMQGVVLGAIFYATVRMFRLSRLDAGLICLLLMSTAAAWFWFGLAETFLLGAVSMLIPVIWIAAPRGPHDGWTAVAQSFISLTITITNWFAGIAAVFIALGWRRCFVVSCIAFSLVGALTVLQYRFFPESGKLFNIWTEDTVYGASGTLWQHIQVFFLHSLATATPDFLVPTTDIRPDGQFSRLQFVAPTAAPLAIAYLLIWAGLIVLGIKALRDGTVPRQPAMLVLSIIAFNFVLHSFYGVETFLYSMHYVPFLAVVASWALLLEWRPLLVRGAILAAAALGFAHNSGKFAEMTAWHNALPVQVVADKRGTQCF